MPKPLYGKKIADLEPFNPNKLKENTERFFTEIVLPSIDINLKSLSEGGLPCEALNLWYLPHCIDVFQYQHVKRSDHLRTSKHFNKIAARKGVGEIVVSYNEDRGWTSFRIGYRPADFS